MAENSVALLVGCDDGLGWANGEFFYHLGSNRLPTKQTLMPIALALHNNLQHLTLFALTPSDRTLDGSSLLQWKGDRCQPPCLITKRITQTIDISVCEDAGWVVRLRILVLIDSDLVR
ncbi:MAG: hypothetical protein VKJ24_07135 [Synechococcales bacterium]|nr:hypothetical protein [Synechococcales bacterium]